MIRSDFNYGSQFDWKMFLDLHFCSYFFLKRLLSLNIKFIYALLYNYLHMEGHFSHEKINK